MSKAVFKDKNYITFFSLAVMLIMILSPQKIIGAAKDALILCFNVIIPAIYPFLIVSSIFVNSSDEDFFRFAGTIMKKLFGISAVGAAAFIPGILCGYPVGASCACKLYENNRVSRSEAESLVAFSNNSGPLFIIGSVGCGILKNAKTGIYLYAIHVICAVLCGIVLKPYNMQTVRFSKAPSVPKRTSVFIDSVCGSTASILKICGFVVAFAVINKLAEPIMHLFPPIVGGLTAAFLELTNGVNTISENINGETLKLVLIGGATGWSGLSVHMQVKSIVSPHKLSMKKYYFSKILSSVLSMFMAYMLFGKTNLTPANTVISKGVINIACALGVPIFSIIAASRISKIFTIKKNKVPEK